MHKELWYIMITTIVLKSDIIVNCRLQLYLVYLDVPVCYVLMNCVL